MTSPTTPYETELNELEGLVEKLASGELNRTDFRARSVHYGVYTQLQSERYFVRLRVPCGIITHQQLQVLANGLRAHRLNLCHLTTRQGIELHDLGAADILPFLRKIAPAGILSHETGGNSVRAIMTCPHSGVGQDERFDVTPYAALLTDCFVRHPAFQKLPRKFKIGFSCCPDDCAHTGVQDLGFRARIDSAGNHGFRVLIGGGTGALPRLGRELLPFVPAGDVVAFTEAVLRVFDRVGNRQNRARSRVKFLVPELGLDHLRKLVLEEWQLTSGGDYPKAKPTVDSQAPAPVNNRPAADLADEPGVREWMTRCTQPQKQDGFNTIRINVGPNGITASQLTELAELLSSFGLAARTRPEQGFLLRWAPTRSLPAIYAKLKQVGLADSQPFNAIVACPGSTCCSNAFTNAPGLSHALVQPWNLTHPIPAAAAGLRLNISGCSNGCAMHAIADLGLEGMARRVGDEWFPAYRVWAGATKTETQSTFGYNLGTIDAVLVPDFVNTLLAYYDSKKNEAESLSAFIERLGVEAITAQLPRTPAQTSEPIVKDWGDTQPYRPRSAKTVGVC